VIRGWSAGTQLASKDGSQLLRQGLENLDIASPNPYRPLFLALLAETHLNSGETGKALSILDSALQLAERTGERVWLAGIHLLFGKVILMQDSKNTQEAEAKFKIALSVAAEQGVKSIEIRAATGLARIWQEQSKEGEAHKILAPVYEWFTEGLNTPDLIEARELLDNLE
jgi:predicted ATPase